MRLSNVGVVLLLLLAVDAASYAADQAPRAHIDDFPADAQSRSTQRQAPAATQTMPGSSETLAPGGERNWTAIEIVLSVAVLIFGAMVFVLQTILIVKLKLDWTPTAILRFNGLTLIITGAILLVTAGYSNQQMAPVIGLLGAVAGYLLGAGEKESQPTKG